jgi:carboxylesterase
MNQRACLLLHGFTGGPYEVQPLADYLAERGWSCFVPTLPGHDGPLESLRFVTRQDWKEGAAAAASSLAERFGAFDLVGFSMGGLLAAYLANRFPVRRLVLLSAAVYYISPKRFAKNVVRTLRSGGSLELKHKTPLPAVFEFMRLVRELAPEIAEVRVPTFIAQGDSDEIVHPRSADYIYARVQGEKERHIMPDSRHLICLDSEAQELFERVGKFLNGGDLA